MELTSQQKRQLEISVLVGASYLDRERPGWAEEIDAGRFNILRRCNGPRGQTIGWGPLHASMKSIPNTNLTSRDLGFWLPKSIPNGIGSWNYLEREWRKAIALRRGDDNG